MENQPNSFDLSNNQAAANPTPADPLNTGNGMPMPPQPAPSTPPPQAMPNAAQPMEITPTMPTPEQPATPTMPTMSNPEPASKKKMIIIIAVVGIILIGAALIYAFSGSSSSADESAPPALELNLSNTLSDNGEADPQREELENIVNELKDTYPVESPPSLTIDAPIATEEESTSDLDSSQKIAR